MIEPLCVLEGHSSSVACLAFDRRPTPTSNTPSSPATVLLSGSSDTNAIVWDLISGQALATLRGHRDQVTCCTLLCLDSPSVPLRAITGSRDGLVKLWEVETGVCTDTLVGIRSPVLSLNVCPREERLLVGASDSHIRMWDIAPLKDLSVTGQASQVLFLVTFHTSHVFLSPFTD